jgi:hypothetical protein
MLIKDLAFANGRNRKKYITSHKMPGFLVSAWNYGKDMTDIFLTESSYHCKRT